MKKPILLALIAATALAPLAASAQEWRGRGNRGGEARAERAQGETQQRPSFNRGGDNNGGGWRQRAERPAGTESQRGGFDRSQWQARRAERQAQAPQAVAQPTPRQAAPVQRQRGDWNRGDGNRGNWNRGDRTQTENRTVTPQQYFGNRIANGQAGQRDWNRDRNDAQRRNWNRNDGQRRDWDRNNDGRRDWNRNDNQRRDWNRNDNQRRDWNRGNDWNRGSRWNRDWRSDRRYDWQGWRNQNRNAYRLPRYYAPRGYNYGYQRFSIGVTLGSILYARNYWINDPWQYRLPPVDYPLEWVRYYNDALLVDIETGEVIDVINDIFW